MKAKLVKMGDHQKYSYTKNPSNSSKESINFFHDEELNKEMEEFNTLYMCHFCQNEFDSKNSLHSHMKSHSPRPLGIDLSKDLPPGWSVYGIRGMNKKNPTPPTPPPPPLPPLPGKRRHRNRFVPDDIDKAVASLLTLASLPPPIEVDQSNDDDDDDDEFPLPKRSKRHAKTQIVSNENLDNKKGKKGVAVIIGYECHICFKTFDSYDALGGHKADHAKWDIEEGDGEGFVDECPNCMKTFSNGKEFGAHLRYCSKVSQGATSSSVLDGGGGGDGGGPVSEKQFLHYPKPNI